LKKSGGPTSLYHPVISPGGKGDISDGTGNSSASAGRSSKRRKEGIPWECFAEKAQGQRLERARLSGTSPSPKVNPKPERKRGEKEMGFEAIALKGASGRQKKKKVFKMALRIPAWVRKKKRENRYSQKKNKRQFSQPWVPLWKLVGAEVRLPHGRT